MFWKSHSTLTHGQPRADLKDFGYADEPDMQPKSGDFIKTKTVMGRSMNIQKSEKFNTSKLFCRTDFDMREIKKEKAGYVLRPKFYTFKSRDE